MPDVKANEREFMSLVVSWLNEFLRKRYLRQLKDQFFEVFFQRTHDHKLADTLTNQIFEELGLPEVAT